MAQRLLLAMMLAAGACTGRRVPASDAPRVDSSPGAGASAASPAWVLAPVGYGPVRVGATVAQLNAALSDTMRAAYDLGGECAYVHPGVLPAAVHVMVHLDTVVRIDVDTAGILTPEGAGIGDTEARLLALYGARAIVTEHKYDGPVGHYVTVGAAGDTARATVFETDGRLVTRLRAGRRPEVEFAEGCS